SFKGDRQMAIMPSGRARPRHARSFAVGSSLAISLMLATSLTSAQVTPTPLEAGDNSQFSSRVLTTGLSNPWEISWGADDMIWVTERSTGEVTRVDPETGAQQTILT